MPQPHLSQALDHFRFLLLHWYYEDEILDTHFADINDTHKMNDRYQQLIHLGLDPYDSELREHYRQWCNQQSF